MSLRARRSPGSRAAVASLPFIAACALGAGLRPEAAVTSKAVTRLEVGFPKGTPPDAARALIEARLRLAAIPLVEMKPVVKPAPGWRVRVQGYHAAPLVRSILEAGELLSVFLVDDAAALWGPIGPSAGAAVHRTEPLDKWHVAHDLVAPAVPILAAVLATLPPPPNRRWLVGAPADGAPGARAVLVVAAPPLVGLSVSDAHVTEAAAGGKGRAVYALLTKEAARRYSDVTAVHTGARLALALGEELVAAARVTATVGGGTLLVPAAKAPSGAAEALAARLRATGASSGLRVAKVTLE